VGGERILFIRATYFREKYPHPRNVKPPITIGYMLSLAEAAGHHCKLIDCRADPSSAAGIVGTAASYKPSLVVIEFATYEYQSTMEMSRALRKSLPSVRLIAMGSHVSSTPESVINSKSCFDFALLGECERDFAKVLKRLEEGRDLAGIDCLYSEEKRDASIAVIENLDGLPWPSHGHFPPELYHNLYPLRLNKKVRWGFVLTTRGCPYLCTFCSPTLRLSYGRKYRTRNPREVVDEIEYLTTHGRNVIEFLDDDFTTNRTHVERVCGEILKRGLDVNWVAHARIDELTREMMQLMKDSGCVLLKAGLESGSQRIIQLLQKNPRGIDWAKTAVEVARTSEEIGLDILPMWQVGHPTETKEDLRSTINLIKAMDPPFIQLAYSTPYPGSGLSAGSPESDHEMYHYSFPSHNPSKLDDQELKKTQRRIYRWFYTRPRFLLKHLMRYSGFYMNNLNLVQDQFTFMRV